jgi:hypothetical protein
MYSYVTKEIHGVINWKTIIWLPKEFITSLEDKIRNGGWKRWWRQKRKKDKMRNLKKKTGSIFLNTMQDISVGIVTWMWITRQTNHDLLPSCNKWLLSVSDSRVTTPVPQGVNLPLFDVNHSPTTSIKLTFHGSILPLPHTPTCDGA